LSYKRLPSKYEPPNLIAPYYRMSFHHMAEALQSQYQVVKSLLATWDAFDYGMIDWRLEKIEYALETIQKTLEKVDTRLAKLEREVAQMKGRVYRR